MLLLMLMLMLMLMSTVILFVSNNWLFLFFSSFTHTQFFCKMVALFVAVILGAYKVNGDKLGSSN